MATDKLSRIRERFRALVADVSNTDPKLAQALNALNDSVAEIVDRLEPLEVSRAAQVAAISFIPDPPTGLTADLSTRENIRLSWNAVAGAATYQVRRGTDWDTAYYVTQTPSLTVTVPPTAVGITTFLVRSVSSAGVLSIESSSVDVVVASIGTPTVTAYVVDNNVLLYWNEPSSTWWIDFYEVYKTKQGGGGVRTKIGELSGLFTVVFEQSGGDYLYEIIPHDWAGNIGAAGTILATVANPPDYASVYNASLVLNAGGSSNYKVEDGKIYVPINLTETISQHFTTPPGGFGGGNAIWDTPQEQVTDGFDLWIQDNPTGTPAATLLFDELNFGAEFSNVIASIAYGLEYLTSPNQPSLAIYIRTAPASHVFGSYILGNNQYITGPVQYMQVKIEVNNSDPDSMMSLFTLSASLDVKREMDSNSIIADASHSGGTTVYTDGAHDTSLGHGRKKFKLIDSITLTTDSLEPIYFIYDDTGIPDYFKILAFDSGGVRITKICSWKVRGIV